MVIYNLYPLGEERGKYEYSLTHELYGKSLKDLFDFGFIETSLHKDPHVKHVNGITYVMQGVRGTGSLYQRMS